MTLIETLKQPWTNRTYLSWMILAMAATNVIFLGGKRRAFGMFVAQLRVEYDKMITLKELNWIGDSYAALGYMTTTLSSAVIIYFSRRYALFQFIGSCFVLLSCITSSLVPNPHWLFLTHTLLHGIGSSLILSVVGLVVNEHFPKNHEYRLLATTLVSGGSVASIVFVTFYAYLIQTLDWRVALAVLGVIYFFVNNLGTLFFRVNQDLDVREQSKLNCSFFKTFNFWQFALLFLWFLDRIMTTVVVYGMLLNLGDYQLRKTNSLLKSSILTTLFASGEASTYLIGAIITAITKTFLTNRIKYIFVVTSLLMSISLIVWELSQDNVGLSYFLAFSSGFFLGPCVTFLFPGGEEMTTLPGHMAYPFSLAGMGVGMTISPLFTAAIAEVTDYKYFFVIQGGIFFLKFICDVLCIVIHKCVPHKLNLMEEEDEEILEDGEVELEKELDELGEKDAPPVYNDENEKLDPQQYEKYQ